MNGETASGNREWTAIRLIVVGFVPEGVKTERGTCGVVGVADYAKHEDGKRNHIIAGNKLVAGPRGLGPTDSAVGSSDVGTSDENGASRSG